jgi:UDP-N-acetylglucosamine 2-epimerase
VVFPVHPRTRRRIPAPERYPDVRFLAPVGYLEFLSLEADAAAVLTDSGRVQEETTCLGAPCFTRARPTSAGRRAAVRLRQSRRRSRGFAQDRGRALRSCRAGSSPAVPCPLLASERIADNVIDWLE